METAIFSIRSMTLNPYTSHFPLSEDTLGCWVWEKGVVTYEKLCFFGVCRKVGPLEMVSFFYLFFKTFPTGLVFVRGVEMSALWSAVRVAFSMLRVSCKPWQMLIRREVNPDLAQLTWKCVYACPSGIFLCYVGGQFSWNTTKIMTRRKPRAGTDYMNPTCRDWLRRCWAQVYTLPAGLCLFHERALSLLLKHYYPGKTGGFLVEVPRSSLHAVRMLLCVSASTLNVCYERNNTFRPS